MKLVIKYLDNNTKRIHTRTFKYVFYGSPVKEWPIKAQKLIDDMDNTIITIYFQLDIFGRAESG